MCKKWLVGLFSICLCLGLLVAVPQTIIVVNAADNTPTPTQNNTGGVNWLITTNPSFAYIGENITFTVHGAPSVYVSINIQNATNYSMQNGFFQLNQNGVGNFTYAIPYNVTTSYFNAIVSIGDLNLTNVKFEVIYNEDMYLLHEFNLMKADYEKTKSYSITAASTAQYAYSQLQTNFYMVFFALIISLCCLALVIVSLKKYWAQSISMMEVKDATMEKLTFLFNPPPRGLLYPYSTHLRTQIETEKEKLRMEYEGKMPFKPMVIYPNKNNPAGFSVKTATFFTTKEEMSGVDDFGILNEDSEELNEDDSELNNEGDEQ